MENIVTVINEVNEAIEIQVQGYLKSSDSIDDMTFNAPVYTPTQEDFAIYFPKPKPFQRVVGTVNFIKQP